MHPETIHHCLETEGPLLMQIHLWKLRGRGHGSSHSKREQLTDSEPSGIPGSALRASHILIDIMLITKMQAGIMIILIKEKKSIYIYICLFCLNYSHFMQEKNEVQKS